MIEYNVIYSVWFGTIGIVSVRPEFGDDKFYIGNTIGNNKHEDEQAIAMNGMPYYSQAGFFNVH